MEYNLITQETGNNFTKMIEAELNSIRKLTETITFQTRKHNNEKVRSAPYLEKVENTQHIPTLKLISNLELNKRLYKVVQLFLISLTEFINSANKRLQPNQSRIITSPALSCLSTVCSILWKRIQVISIVEEKNIKILCNFENTIEEGEVKILPKATQTENSCLMYCESCYLSTKLLKSLVRMILIEQREYNVEDSLVASYRESIGVNVVDLSQWGAMNGWVSAVEGDLKRAADFLRTTMIELKKVRVNQEVLRKKHENSTNNLKDTLQTVKSQLEAEKAQNGYLMLQVESLKKTLKSRVLSIDELSNSLTEQRNKFEELVRSINGLKKKTTQLKQSQEYITLFVRNKFTVEVSKISELNKKVQLSIQLIQQSVDSQFKNEGLKFLELRMNMCKKDEEVKELLSRCSAASEEHLKLKQKNQALTTDLSNMKEEFTIKTNELQDIISKLEKKEIEANQIIKDQSNEIQKLSSFDFYAKSALVTSFEQKLQVSGDPIKDMEQQRLLNKQKIKALIRENERLKITIRKLKGVGSVDSYESSLDG